MQDWDFYSPVKIKERQEEERLEDLVDFAAIARYEKMREKMEAELASRIACPDEDADENLRGENSRGGVLKYHSTSLFKYDGHVNTKPLVVKMKAGQHVRIVVQNLHWLGVILNIENRTIGFIKERLFGDEMVYETQTKTIQAWQSAEFDFWLFAETPVNWKFVFTTDSPMASVGLKFYSDWVDGMPSDKDNRK